MKFHPNDLKENGLLKAGIYQSLRAYLAASTFVSLLRPTHERICKEALEKFKPLVEDNELNQMCDPEEIGTPITEWNQLVRASDKDTKAIYAFHKSEMAKAGHKTDNPETCAWLIAVNLEGQAKGLLMKSMESYTGIHPLKLFGEKQDRYIELLLGMLVPLCNETTQPLTFEMS